MLFIYSSLIEDFCLVFSVPGLEVALMINMLRVHRRGCLCLLKFVN